MLKKIGARTLKITYVYDHYSPSPYFCKYFVLHPLYLDEELNSFTSHAMLSKHSSVIRLNVIWFLKHIITLYLCSMYESYARDYMIRSSMPICFVSAVDSLLNFLIHITYPRSLRNSNHKPILRHVHVCYVIQVKHFY